MKVRVTLDENGNIDNYITEPEIETLYAIACLELGLRWVYDRRKRCFGCGRVVGVSEKYWRETATIVCGDCFDAG